MVDIQWFLRVSVLRSVIKRVPTVIYSDNKYVVGCTDCESHVNPRDRGSVVASVTPLYQ